MSANLDPVPLGSPITADGAGRPLGLTGSWQTWFLNLWTIVRQTARQLAAVVLVNQSASIGTTAIPTGALTGGRYRITWYARITVADGVASSLTVSFGWTDGGVTCGFSAPAITGDSVTTVQTDSILVECDAPGTLTYSTLYASTTPAKMRHKLSILVEACA